MIVENEDNTVIVAKEQVVPIFLSRDQLVERLALLKMRINEFERELAYIDSSLNKIEPERYLTIDMIINTVLKVMCHYFDVTKEEVLSKKRHRKIVRARHFFIYFVRLKSKMTLSEIGTVVGRDHTSCTHAINEINSQLTNKFDDAYREDYSTLKRMYDDNLFENNLPTHLTNN
jgi:chromosomal replication initiation ATPase DnaA